MVTFGLLIFRKKKNKWIYKFWMSLLGCIAIGYSIILCCFHFDIISYLKYTKQDSTIYEDNYVDGRDVAITFPKEKRNLIYIFLESMEMTYSDQSVGGAMSENYIPELTQISLENENFGIYGKLNGAYTTSGATFTMGGLVAQTSGVPINENLISNDTLNSKWESDNNYVPGVWAIGDVLKGEGYNQEFLIGSDKKFAGRSSYFHGHGNYDIFDYYTAIDRGYIDDDYMVWWGYEDEKLFGFAKEKLLELSQQDNPFNLTMLTVDTHFEDGYVCDICPDTFGDNQYANVMACSSRQVKEFVDWVQQQDFAADTTIVISGDHPTMDSDFCKDVDKDYERRVYTTYINAGAEKQTNEKRNYTTFDNFPTTLAAMGVEIEGDRLGLGTNLYSTQQTLTERFGIEKEEKELKRKSKLLNQMAQIDKKKYEEEIAAQTDPTAKAKAGKYNAETEEIPITVKKVQYADKGIQSIMAAVWKYDDQSDLQWVPLAMYDGDVWKGNINISGYDSPEGAYNIHLYLVDGNGDLYNIACTSKNIKINNE